MPDTSVVIPELKTTLKNVRKIYTMPLMKVFRKPTLGPAYQSCTTKGVVQFAERQPIHSAGFDRFGLPATT